MVRPAGRHPMEYAVSRGGAVASAGVGVGVLGMKQNCFLVVDWWKEINASLLASSRRRLRRQSAGPLQASTAREVRGGNRGVVWAVGLGQ